MLRSTSAFDQDETMQKYIKNGQARLIKGDTLKAETVKAGWEAALEAGNGSVDLALFTVGMSSPPHETPNLLDQANIPVGRPLLA